MCGKVNTGNRLLSSSRRIIQDRHIRSKRNLDGIRECRAQRELNARILFSLCHDCAILSLLCHPDVRPAGDRLDGGRNDRPNEEAVLEDVEGRLSVSVGAADWRPAALPRARDGHPGGA